MMFNGGTLNEIFVPKITECVFRHLHLSRKSVSVLKLADRH